MFPLSLCSLLFTRSTPSFSSRKSIVPNIQPHATILSVPMQIGHPVDDRYSVEEDLIDQLQECRCCPRTAAKVPFGIAWGSLERSCNTIMEYNKEVRTTENALRFTSLHLKFRNMRTYFSLLYSARTSLILCAGSHSLENIRAKDTGRAATRVAMTRDLVMKDIMISAFCCCGCCW